MQKILIIDGHKELREFLGYKIDSQGFEVIQSRDGFDGLIKMKNEIPDLIIVDLHIERTDILQFLKEKTNYKSVESIPVIVMSSETDSDIIEKLIKFNVHKIIAKPIVLDSFLTVIADILGSEVEYDKAKSLIDMHMNDDILFIEIAQGINTDKLEILEFKLNEFRTQLDNNLHKILIIFSDFDESSINPVLLESLYKKIILTLEISPDEIKTLSINESLTEAIKSIDYLEGIEVIPDFQKAMDSLGKIDVFSYGDEIEQIKTELISKAALLENNVETIDLRFSNEIQTARQKTQRERYVIAVLDDDFYILEFMATVLERDRWIVNTYENAKLFIEDLPDNKPDMIFLDIMMPQMNGFELLDYLQKNGISIPTVLVSALTDKNAVLKARQYGVDSYMTKPLKAESIEAKAEEVLGDIDA